MEYVFKSNLASFSTTVYLWDKDEQKRPDNRKDRFSCKFIDHVYTTENPKEAEALRSDSHFGKEYVEVTK